MTKLFDFHFVSKQKIMFLVMVRLNLSAHLNIRTCYWCWGRSICETFFSDDMSHPVSIQNCFKVCFYLQCMQGRRSRGGRSALLSNSSTISPMGKGRLSRNINTIKPSPIQITNKPPTSQDGVNSK